MRLSESRECRAGASAILAPASPMPSYDHTQRGPLAWMFLAVAVGFLAAGFFVDEPGRWLLPVAGSVFALLALTFARLRVRDIGAALERRYGPLPLLGWTFRYDEITDVTPTRSSLVDGWGIHWVPRRGWTLNLWGFECVELRLRGKRCRIGTNDSKGLAAFLRARTEPDGPPVFRRRAVQG